MAKLSTAQRNKMPAKEFAGPGRSYSIPDASHAANAKARASQAVNAGRMSKPQEAKIDAKANAKLNGGKSTGGKATAPRNDPPKHAPVKVGNRLAGWKG